MEFSRLQDVLPLSPLQKGFLFQSCYDSDAEDVYNLQLIYRVQGRFEIDRLRWAARQVLSRHSNLRAGFLQDGFDDPIQFIQKDVPFPWEELDLSGAAPDEKDELVSKSIDADRRRRFDLSHPPAIRFTTIKLGRMEYCFVITCHHILLDGWSMSILQQELWSLYGAKGADDLPFPTPYRDYLSWLNMQDQEAAKAAWRNALQGLNEPTRALLQTSALWVGMGSVRGNGSCRTSRGVTSRVKSCSGRSGGIAAMG
jgi:Condensation domain